MRTIPVQASRSVKIKDLSAKYQAMPEIVAALKANAESIKNGEKVPRLEEWIFASSEGATAEVAADLDEAIALYGKAATYEVWLRQTKTDVQVRMASDIQDAVLDPSKNKRGGAVTRIKL